MIKILYEDDAVLVAVKPAGLESQASRKLEPDMVSEIKNYLLRSRRRKEKGPRPPPGPPTATCL